MARVAITMPPDLWKQIKIAAIEAGFTNPSAYIVKVMTEVTSSGGKKKDKGK